VIAIELVPIDIDDHSFLFESDVKEDGLALIYIDRYVPFLSPWNFLTAFSRHLVHEVTSPQAFEGL